ncbi:MutS protein -like protein [Trametes pubescens]|uniref:MutS protein-like protein n=1 Tax=Trametes pubescens TaxID=154538 RepID=A0A1M2W1Z0_TRAPU|nr:MutS protein -like protein [Trametes pubescens]
MLRHKSTSRTSSHIIEDDDEGITERVEDPSDSEDTQPRKKVRWDGNVDTPDEEENEESSSTNVVEKICLAASCQSGRVACAYYDPVRRTVFIFEDTPENQHFDLTKTFLEQTCPDVVLTSSKADDNFMDVCRDHMDGSGGTFQVRPQKDFLPLKGRDRLLSLRLLSELPVMQGSESDQLSELGSTSEPRNAYDFMRRRREIGGDPTLQKWNASVRLANFASVESSPLCLGSIGALLDYLARTRAVAELDDEGVGGLEVLNIELLPLLDVMQINADALFSLQIFEDENHASIHSDKTKEGLSLFGILNNTKTTLGRALMREWFLRPSMSLVVINARHDAVECFTRADNIITATAMHGHIQGTKNVPRIIAAMRSGKAKVSDWQSIVKVQSAFMIDLNQVSLALRNCTARSLIILDEFGKGTLPAGSCSYGSGLFCGVLKHLLESGTFCPKVIATTHFHEIFHNDLLSPHKLPITFLHMQVLLASSETNAGVLGEHTLEGSDDDETTRLAPSDKITYLYKVASGYSLHSHAITCAEIFGVPRRVTARARYASELLARHELCQLLDEAMSDSERHELEEAEEVCRKFLAWDLSGERDGERKPSLRDELAEVLGRCD